MKTKKKSKFPIPKQEYTYLWSTKYYVFSEECNISYVKRRKVLAASNPELIFYNVNGYKTSYGTLKSVQNAYKYGNLFLKKKCFNKHVNKFNKLKKKREQFINYINKKDLSKIPDKLLFKLVKTFAEILSEVIAYFVISRPEYTDHLSEKLLEELKKKSDESIAYQYLVILSMSTKIDIIKKELKARLLLLKHLTKRNIKNHILNFPWLYWTDLTYERPIIDLTKKLKKESSEELRKKLNQGMKELDELKKKKHALLKKYNSKKVKLLSNRISWLGHNRFEVKSRFAGFELACNPLFKEISRRGKVSLQNIIKYYHLNDIKKLIINKKKLSQKDIKERKIHVFYTHKGKVHFLQGKKAIEFAKYYLKEHLEKKEVNEVKGVIASKGYAKGVCRIIIIGKDADLSNFKKGEVLITEMTSPRMIPIIEKCIAIVTNEGGLASHASIVSREFNIPCIVGTKTATKVFKNGDYVEVDANKGVVRKLN